MQAEPTIEDILQESFYCTPQYESSVCMDIIILARNADHAIKCNTVPSDLTDKGVQFSGNRSECSACKHYVNGQP